MGYFLARGLIGLDSQSNCSKASSVVSMGLVSAFSSILLFYPSAFMFIENFSQQQLLSKSCYALERGSIKLLRLIPIITIKNWVLWLDVFSDIQTQMHTEIPQRHYTRYVESISQSLDTLISLPYPPPPKKPGISLLHTLHQLALSSGSSLARAAITTSISSLHEIRSSSANNALKAVSTVPLEDVRSEWCEADRGAACCPAMKRCKEWICFCVNVCFGCSPFL